MKNEIKNVLSEIDEILLLLDNPITNTEKKNGWTKEVKKGLTEFFNDLKIQISENNEISESVKKTSIIRGLDSWGIQEGKIFEKAIHLSTLLREE